MQLTRSSLQTTKGPDDWFTGDVYVDTVAGGTPPSRIGGSMVHFTPGARTAWHTHPIGQSIYIVEGIGRCCREGGSIEELRPGDRVYFEPGENHWHGAAPDRFMVHLALSEADDQGTVVVWGEHVSDEDYLG